MIIPLNKLQFVCQKTIGDLEMLRSLIYKEIVRDFVGLLPKDGAQNAQKNMQRRTGICAGRIYGCLRGRTAKTLPSVRTTFLSYWKS